MKAPFSPYLSSLAPFMKDLVKVLGGQFDYVSILSTDSSCLSIRISQRSKAVEGSSMTSERGSVVRVHQQGLYSEYSFNDLDLARAQSADDVVRGTYASEYASLIAAEIEKQIALLKKTNTVRYETPVLGDEPLVLLSEKEADILPEDADAASLVDTMSRLSDEGMKKLPGAIDCMVRGQSTHVNKMFISANRYLRQSYVFCEGSVSVIAPGEDGVKFGHEGISGQCGFELFDKLEECLDKALKDVQDCQKAGHIEPGEYDIITTPSISGLIAHEAFGHGVEMDMFVKDRALGKEYINERVGSDHVTMHEGALCADTCTAYAFDDEGTLAGDVTEIDKGILKTGICDALSALRLGVKPTGNGKRQNFEHKVYTRMTNTVFDSGTDKVEDMIASISYGYLLDGMDNGMEDPKHWGIQCTVSRGYEIKDGKLTGKVVSPVVMTGYVPDLLGSVSMCSADRYVDGCGYCGKGYKEWVKVADGGPYLKARARLG